MLHSDVRFEVVTMMSRKNAVFWDVMPCSVEEICRRLGQTSVNSTRLYGVNNLDNVRSVHLRTPMYSYLQLLTARNYNARNRGTPRGWNSQ
jgi:hypothetical protein